MCSKAALQAFPTCCNGRAADLAEPSAGWLAHGLSVKHSSAEGAEEVCEARMETSHGAQGLLTEVPWQVMAEMCHVAFTFKSLPLPLKWQQPSPIIRNKYQNKDTPSQSDEEQSPTSE